jgi:hypothetical protein
LLEEQFKNLRKRRETIIANDVVILVLSIAYQLQLVAM